MNIALVSPMRTLLTSPQNAELRIPVEGLNFQIMTVTITIPDVLALVLSRVQPTLQRAILEGFAVEGYRQGTFSAAEVRVLLGHDSRWETEDFLSAHHAWPGTTAEQVAEDGRKLHALLSR